MIQLFIDYATNKILGYNTVIPVNAKDIKDMILIENEEFEKIKSVNLFDKYYYENGQIIEKEDIDEDYKQLKEIMDLEKKYKSNVENEQTIFMNSILNGKTMEEATGIIKSNRDSYETAKQTIKDFNEKLFQRRENNIISMFEKEEEEIDTKYFLSILTTVRDENEYLVEWLNYHIEIGVDHFYIYDNESVEPIQTYLENINYEHIDKVTVIPWETTSHTQQDTCNDWLRNYGLETKWFICMDIDEFIKIKENQNKTLIDFLNENTKYSSIKCKWKHYTANGHVEKTSEPVMERFTVETDWHDWKNGGKYFAQSNRTTCFTSYVPQLRLGTKTSDNEISANFYQLNHYFTKSYEEYVEKIKRGSVNPNLMRRLEEFFEVNPDMEYLNTGEDMVQKYGTNNSN